MRPTISRRDLLRLGAAGMVGTAVVASTRPANADSPTARTANLLPQVQHAAGRHGVPVALLLAMGYLNTRLETPPPGASAYRPGDPEGRGVYGMMALVRNPAADTVGLAARITGIPADELMGESLANLHGGAALLAHSQGTVRPAHARDWLGAVAGTGGHGPALHATAGVGGGELYADQLADVLAHGFTLRTSRDEHLALPAQGRGL
jgi:hypothetical protein